MAIWGNMGFYENSYSCQKCPFPLVQNKPVIQKLIVY
jgi:hypothetical protein